MTAFKLLIGVILIVLHLRLTGKQQTAQLTPIDFIGSFILGGIIGGGVVYNQAFSFAEYIGFLLVTFGIISGLNYLTSKFMSTRSLVMGKAYTIIEGGRFTQDALDSKDLLRLPPLRTSQQRVPTRRLRHPSDRRDAPHMIRPRPRSSLDEAGATHRGKSQSSWTGWNTVRRCVRRPRMTTTAAA